MIFLNGRETGCFLPGEGEPFCYDFRCINALNHFFGYYCLPLVKIFLVPDRLTDREHLLLNQLAEGDERAFDALFHLHWDYVYSAAMMLMKSSVLANDVAQDTFLALWRNRERLRGIENLKGFLRTHVKFLVHKRFRRMKTEDAYLRYLQQANAASNENIEQEEYIGLKQLETSIQEGIAKLPPQQQRAFKLSREQGLTHEQISALMGVSKKTVKDYIVRTIAFLRPFLKRYSSILVFLFQ